MSYRTYLLHELECAEAAFAILIEKATTHKAKRELITERNKLRRMIFYRLSA